MNWKQEPLKGGHIRAMRTHGPVTMLAMSSRFGGAWLITLNDEKIAQNVAAVPSRDIAVTIQACEDAARKLTAAFIAMGYAPSSGEDGGQ